MCQCIQIPFLVCDLCPFSIIALPSLKKCKNIATFFGFMPVQKLEIIYESKKYITSINYICLIIYAEQDSILLIQINVNQYYKYS